MRPQRNKLAIAAAFGRAAARYDNYATLQRASGEQLIALAPGFSPGRTVLDAGCGTGHFSAWWRRQGGYVVALDLSLSMLRYAQHRCAANSYLLGDIEQLPLKDHCVDLTFCNLALQWCSDLRSAILQLMRVTRPGGTVLFSTVVRGSITEINQAWHSIDERAHSNTFLTREQILTACAGLALQVVEERITCHFATAYAAMYSLKGTGATWLNQGRTGAGLNRQQLQQLEQDWPKDQHGYLLTWCLLFGTITT